MMTQACRGCGQPLANGASFCPNCGVRAEGNGATVHTGTQPVVVTQSAVQPVAQTAQVTPPAVTQPVMVAAPVAPPVAADTAARSRQLKWLAGISALLLVMIAGVFGFMGADRPEPVGQLVAEGPITAEGGGTIPFENGGKVQAPAGAVSETQNITVRKTFVQREIQIGSRTYPPGTFTLFIFGPNITFLRPVTIILPLPADAIAGRIYVLVGGRLIFLQQRPNQGGFVRFTVTGFNAGQLVGVRG